MYAIRSYYGRAPARNGHLIQGGQFTGDGLHLNDDVWGGKTGDDPVEGVPPGPPDVAPVLPWRGASIWPVSY